MPNPGMRLEAGEWLRRKHDHWELIKVVKVTPDGGVRIVTLDDRELDTTIGYLRYQFEKAGEESCTRTTKTTR